MKSVKTKTFILVAAALLLSPPQLPAQYFGKNKVQYTDFKWKYLQSKHFNIYFTEGGVEIAHFVAAEAEAAHRHLSADFRYELTDRITIIVYNSHNDFEQTNVDLNPAEESVGGFTEFFKNRVVIPFDGSWERLRHVTHHELTHAVMLQMVYGGGVMAIITGLTKLRLPLWFVEGLAEFESRGWDTESDMFMRDAAINDYLPNSLDMFGGFLAYKGGQSVWYYLAQKYGAEKAGEILGKVKIHHNLDKGLKAAIGLESDELAEHWLRHIKKTYWPEMANRKEPEEIAKTLTDHRQWHNFVNNSPALSPRGDKIAFLSNKSDYFDIYVMNAIDGSNLTRLVSGQRSEMLEELHWLRPGISWSPDGRFIVFASKSGKEDELHILDVKRKKIVRCKKFGLDGVFSPAWSPSGNEIAFTGFTHGQSDIYLWDMRIGEVHKVTDDVFSDLEPSWSPNGRQLAFVSDRGWAFDKPRSANFKIENSDYHNLDIYIIDRDGSSLYRVTATPGLEHTPVFSPVDGAKLAFTSDRSGIFNIYIKNLRSNEEYPITDVVTGISQLSWAGDGRQMAFGSFYEAGYDIYLLRNPLDIKPGQVNPAKTEFITAREAKQEVRHTFAHGVYEKPAKTVQSRFQNFVFGEEFASGVLDTTSREPQPVALDSATYLLPSGRHKVRDYKTKFSPDILFGNAGYSQYFGVRSLTQLSFSDVLGNQRFNVYTNLYGDLSNSSLLVNYFYLPKRTNVGLSVFQTVYFFGTSYGAVARDRSYGINLNLSRPFDRYRRTDFTLTLLGIDRDWVAGDSFIPSYRRNVLLGELAYVTDTS
ncbi:hypothetical protein L0337_08115 [candidate division KSB1 bacterium]|nr:hypothetical protein [candidate division KSB1 bacterium]